MPSVRLLLLLPLVLAAVLLPGAAHSAATATALNVVVGPGYTIKVTDANGKAVTQLDPGDYSITIKNLSPQQEHNFHLVGPGINKASAFDNTTVTWDVTLANGTYNYHCDAHPYIKGSFHVGALPPPAPKLNGRVGPGKVIWLKTSAGVLVKKLPGGTYKLTVKDSSKSDDFHLLGPGVNKKTGVKFRGTVRWTAKFLVGRKYTVKSDAHKKLLRTFTATSPPLPG